MPGPYQAPNPSNDVARQIRSFAAGSISGDIDLAGRPGVVTHPASFVEVHNNDVDDGIAAGQSITLAGEDDVDFTIVVAPGETRPVPGAVRRIRSAGIGADLSVTAYWLIGASPKNP